MHNELFDHPLLIFGCPYCYRRFEKISTLNKHIGASANVENNGYNIQEKYIRHKAGRVKLTKLLRIALKELNAL